MWRNPYFCLRTKPCWLSWLIFALGQQITAIKLMKNNYSFRFISAYWTGLNYYSQLELSLYDRGIVMETSRQTDTRCGRAQQASYSCCIERRLQFPHDWGPDRHTALSFAFIRTYGPPNGKLQAYSLLCSNVLCSCFIHQGIHFISHQRLSFREKNIVFKGMVHVCADAVPTIAANSHLTMWQWLAEGNVGCFRNRTPLLEDAWSQS